MSNIPRSELTPGYTTSKLLKGGWQLAGGHGNIDSTSAIADMNVYYEAGITTFDCADIYTGVEEMIGKFRRERVQRLGADSVSQLRVHTKFVPDLALLASMNRQLVEQTIDRSLQRLGVEQLDLVQFHWWDYSVQRYLEVAHILKALQTAGKIKHLGGTNFDTTRTRELVNTGIGLVSMQVQFSLLDQRPALQLQNYCADAGMQLLCYGSLAGGFMSKRWLGVTEADAVSLENRSLVKYKLIIDEFGGWDLFQNLLAQVNNVANKHDVSISAVAVRWVLQQPQVAGVIVGVRRGSHLPDHLGIFGFELDADDIAQLDQVLAQRKPSTQDVYAWERNIEGAHGRIMKYDLNEAPH